jgi:O-antigen ligase
MNHRFAVIVAIFIAALGGVAATMGMSMHLVAGLMAVAFLVFVLKNPVWGFCALLFLYPFIEVRVQIDIGARIPAVTMTRVLTLVFLVLIVMRKRQEIRGPSLRRTLITPELLLVAFCGLALLSAIRSRYPVHHAQWVLDSMIVPALFYVISKDFFQDRRNIQALTTTLTILAVVTSIIAVLQYVTGKGLGLGRAYTWDVLRVSGPFPSAAIMGSVLAAIVPLTFYEALHSERHRTLWYTAMGITFGGILVSFFRTCWAAILVEMIVLSIIATGRLKARLRTAAAGLLLISVGFSLRLQAVAKRLAAQSSIYDRLAFYQTAVNMALKHPLTGVGFRNFRYLYGYYLTTIGIPAEEARRIKRAKYIIGKALGVHNSYLQILAEQGFPAFLAFLSILFVFLRRVIALWRAAPDVAEKYRDKIWYAILIIEFVGFCIPLIFQSMIYYSPFTNLIFFITMGIAAADYERVTPRVKKVEQENRT